jgi:putative membrane protein
MRIAFSGKSMEEGMTTRKRESSNEQAESRTRLATERTVMAADRSLMAWVRTALSMISFGFAIYKILIGFQENGAELPKNFNARETGLFLIGLGTVSMVVGNIEYWFRITKLKCYKCGRILKMPAFVMALLISMVGLVLFFGIVINVL